MGEGEGSKGCVPLLLTSSPSPKLSPTMGAKQMIGQSSDFSIHLLVSLPDHHYFHLYCLLPLTPAP